MTTHHSSISPTPFNLMSPRFSISIIFITLSALDLMVSAAPQTPGNSVGERAYVVFEGSSTCADKSCTKTADCGSKCGRARPRASARSQQGGTDTI
ncbi:hypothetical protein DFH08DRAFT_903762 [Mycena albidolilacea]|uniref:Uncharacterized protein n=1 Tax=Mycena albidolilacea TaxID=1033008 RepID=A0AAD6Z1T8_9AGAR|nr:hypothetical protein DFH08DRAFT_903762 [Mycena albidolilacea]